MTDPNARIRVQPARRASALALLALATACGGDAAERGAAAGAADVTGAPLDAAPVGAALDAPPAAESDEAKEAEVATEVSPGGTAGETPEPVDAAPLSDPSALYADGIATGSAAERDQLAASALGPEVLALREAAKARAKELAEDAEGSEYRFVDFERLVFEDYSPPEYREDGLAALPLEAFPEDVRALHGQKVQLAGFMIAVDFKDKKIEDFMLCRFPPGCCFGGIPLFDEWVDCTPTYDEKRDWSPYEMILVEGTLEVGEVVDQDGFALSIYRMRVDDVRPFD